MQAQQVNQVAEDHIFQVRRFFERSSDDLVKVGARLVRVLQEEGKILLFGNGGSAADAQHIAAELVGRYQHDRAALPAIALTTDTSALTAIGNDYGYHMVFARQIEALGTRRDAAIAISTSGSSANILEGVRAAKARGMVTVGLLGRDGGPVRELLDHALVVESQKTARIQEVHILVGHILAEFVEREFMRRRDG